MLPIPIAPPLQGSQRIGGILREIAPRQDRIPVDERVDLPEIQESFRVSFSEETRVSGSPPESPQAPGQQTGWQAAAIDAYRQIARL